MHLPVRLRRLRRTPEIRRLFQEVDLLPRHLIQPYFVVSGENVRVETPARSGLWRISVDVLLREARALHAAGVGGVMLFTVADGKSDDPAEIPALLDTLCRAIVELKREVPGLPVFADVCLCTYTPHGHCGHVHDGDVDNDLSLPTLAAQAVQLAEAGVDFVCPSDMMDGRVAAIRVALDAAGQTHVGIVSYAIKMASAMYGPFRVAADSSPGFGDRKGYQMPETNRREALRELALDIDEGADVLLVKPALTNLDLIRDARETTDLPLCAYQVSGEVLMLRAAADAGLMDYDRAMRECLLSMRRAGADLIVTYHARVMAGLTD
jgi:porphobilinogen synthase